MNKSSGNIFNFDKSIGEKATPKDKTLPAILLADDIGGVKYSETNMRDIIINRLYDKNCYDKMDCMKQKCNNIVDGLQIKKENPKINDTIIGNKKNVNKIDNCDYPKKNTKIQPNIMLFAENHTYSIALSSNGCTYTKLDYSDSSPEEYSTKDIFQLHENEIPLKSLDLLQFSKQIALGMVTSFYL